MAALDAWAELGVVPDEAAQDDPGAGEPAEPGARRGARGDPPPRHGGVRGRGRGDARRGRPVVPLRPHVLGHRRHGALAAGARGGRAAARRPRAGAGCRVARAREHRHTVCMGRTHGVHAEPTTFGLKLAGWAFELDRAANGSPAGARADAGRQALRRGRHLRGNRPRAGADRVRAARPRARARVHAGRPARPARRAADGAGARRRLARALRDGDPPPRPHRGRRGRGAVRQGPEGLLGDAAQAQPGRLRAASAGSRASCGRTRWSGSRTWRSGTSATSRTRRPSACHPGLVPRARLHARPLRLARRGARGAIRSGCCATSRRPTGSSSASVSCWRSSSSGLERDAAYRLVQRNALQAQEEDRDFRELVSRGRRDRRSRRPRRDLRPRLVHKARRHGLRAACRSRPKRGASSCLRRQSTWGAARSASCSSSTTDRLLLVASDRISTFDVVLPTEIPDKGRVLTGLSGFWFARTREVVREPPARAEARRPLERVPAAGDAAARVRRPRLSRGIGLEGLPRDRVPSAATSSLRACSSRPGSRSRSSRRRRRRPRDTTRTSTESAPWS